jgi:hypothetical protein
MEIPVNMWRRLGMRKSLFAVVCLVMLLNGVCSLAQPSSSSPRLKLMQDRLARREAVVSGWASDASQQVGFALAVGLLGILIGAAQASERRWIKGFTVGAGLCVSAFTLSTKILYPADYRTLERSVEQASPILEDMQGIVATFDPQQTLDNQLAVETEFKTKCGKIDLIGQRLLGVDPPSQGPTNASLFHVRVVHAQSPQTPPAWTGQGFRVDKSGTYFVGAGDNTSLAAAKTASFEKAVSNAARWLRGDEPGGSESVPPPQLLDFVRNAAEIADTWYAYDRNTGAYRYYTSLRLTSEFRRSDLKNLISDQPDTTAGANDLPELQAPISVKLANDTASPVAKAGLILLLKHMGAIPITADLYVLSGQPDGTKAIRPYSGDRTAGDANVAWLKTALHSCNGESAKIGGYTVWCFRVVESSINQKKGKAQALGSVWAGARQLDLSAVGFDSDKHSIEVQVRAGTLRVAHHPHE